MTQTAAQGIRWDLSDLYRSCEDPKIEEDLGSARKLAERFESAYKPFFGNPAPETLSRLLKDYKEILTLLTRLSVYASLYFSERTQDAAAGAFLQKIQTGLTEIESRLVFFPVGFARLDDAAAAALAADPAIAADRHYLEQLRVHAPHTLLEGEEKIMAVKANTGRHGFSRLFDETVSGIAFRIERDGQETTMTEGEVLALLHDPDRAKRRKASESLAEGLKSHTRLLTFLLNRIVEDHLADLKIRKYAHPIDPRNLANEISRESVDNLLKSVQEAYPLAQRFYRLKARCLGLGRLADYDRYAPVGADDAAVPFEKCREIVLSAYRGFSAEAGEIVDQFFAKRWIDAEIRPGKRGGGFCCSTTPDLHPYILVNYTGCLRDVLTVAHELGHGLHQWLARRAGILESDSPLTMAETASVFGEMLVFENLLRDERDPARRLTLLCGMIDDHFATVFRQVALTDFELSVHERALSQGELAEEVLNDLWIGANAKLYGDTVDLTDSYRHGWKYISHFVHSPFYCYAYAFAQLFVLCLFARFRRSPEGFVQNYFEALSLGGSRRPDDLAKLLGLNLKDPDLWRNGLGILEGFVREAESLADAVLSDRRPA